MTLMLRPIGVIHSPFQRQEGTPIQSRFAEGVEGSIDLLPEYREGLEGLDEFERIWLIYWFDRAGEARMRVQPYLDPEHYGLFATRAPSRPNPIGLSSVKLLSVEGLRLRIADVDILDETPLLDIKPYVAQFDAFDTKRHGWLDRRSGGGGERTRADNRFEK